MGKVVSGIGKAIGSLVSGIGKLFGLEMVPKVDTQPYNQNLLTNETAPTSYIGVVYGVRRKAGVRIATFVKGVEREHLYAIYALSHGPIKSISNPRMDDVPLATAAPSGFSDWSYGLGAHDQNAATDPLIAELGSSWDTVNGKLQGVAFAIVKITINPDKQVSFGNLTFDIHGKEVFDPRTGLTEWSDNPSLCALDYQTDPIYGKRMPYPQSFNPATYIDAANYFDEVIIGGGVPIDGTLTNAAVGRSQGYFTVSQALFHAIAAGETYQVTGFTDPADNFAGLVASKEVYRGFRDYGSGYDFDPTYSENLTEYRVFMVEAKSMGTFTNQSVQFTQDSKRYTCNGNVDTSQTLFENLKALSSSFNGYITFFNGVSTIIPDRPEPVSASFDTSNITSEISIALPDKTTQLNEITGTWFDPEFGYDQMTATVESSEFLARDGGKVQSKEINMPFCNNPQTVDRILTVELNKSRHSGPVEFETFWSALEILAGDVIDVTDEELGWTARTFRVVRIGIPDIDNSVSLTCIPYDADDYVEGSLNPRKLNDYVDFGRDGDIQPPSNVTISPVPDRAYAVLNVSWTPATGQSHDVYDLEIHSVTRDVEGNISEFQLLQHYKRLMTTSYLVTYALEEGKEYDFRVYARDQKDTRSGSFARKLHVHGKLEAPEGVSLEAQSPWSVRGVPNYSGALLHQRNLVHNWYITEYSGGAEPSFNEGLLVMSAPELAWSGLQPNKNYRLWVRAKNNFGVSDVYPEGAGTSFTTPDTTSDDLGSGNSLPDTQPIVDEVVGEMQDLFDEFVGENPQQTQTDLINGIWGNAQTGMSVADEGYARETKIEEIQVNIADNYATILYMDEVIATESEARATSIQQLETNVANTYATITYTNNAVSNESSARATAISSLSTSVANTYATITYTNDAVSTESNARAIAISNLSTSVANTYATTTRVDGVESSADGSATALSGIRTSVGATGANDTQKQASAELILGSIKDVTDTVKSSAVLGVTAGGQFTGVTIVGENTTDNESVSRISFKSDVFDLVDSNDVPRLFYQDGKWKFGGDLEAVGGTFTGSLSAATGTFSGQITTGTNFSVDSAGILNATSATMVNLSALASTSGGTAVIGSSTISSGQGTGVQGSGGFIGVKGWTGGEALGYSFYADGIGELYTSYGPFTGAHDGLVSVSKPNWLTGDIVCDKTLINIQSVSDVICEMELSSAPNQKSARGVFVARSQLSTSEVAGLDNEPETSSLALIYDRISFNALGEGAINVCGEGGDIQVGDLITTSSMIGKGMKQLDQDNLKPYTVAQSRQNVTFSSSDEVKQIACIYKCG